jgi:FixJ family two-component response regulator
MYSESEPVCILDDDPLVRQFLQLMLDSEGIAARTFERPNDFLTYARDHAVMVAVLDVVMPGMGGLKVQEGLRNISPATRVIMISGRNDPGVRASAMKGGASGFLVKPFGTGAFLDLVRRSLALTA